MKVPGDPLCAVSHRVFLYCNGSILPELYLKCDNNYGGWCMDSSYSAVSRVMAWGRACVFPRDPRPGAAYFYVSAVCIWLSVCGMEVLLLCIVLYCVVFSSQQIDLSTTDSHVI